MKKLIPVFVVLLSFVFSVQSFAYENIIDDSADLFSYSEEIMIQTAIEDFSAEKNFSLAVVTTDFTSGVSSEEYADDYYDYLVDNEGWQEDGLLFLIDTDNRNVWISTCGECILSYSDYEIDNIIDSGYDSLASGYYGDCILSMTEAARLADTAIDSSNDSYYILENGEWAPADSQNDNNIYNYDSYYGYDSYNGAYSSRSSIGFNLGNTLIYILIGLAIGVITVFAVKSRYKNTGRGDEFDADDLILNLTASNDNIVSRNVITTRIPKNNNHHHGGSRGGFSGGGSSVHRSSGGRSHGGGGRSF